MDLTATYSAAYDAWNRLVEVKDGSNVVLKCEYDGLGRRTKTFVNTSDPLDQTYDAYRHFFYSAAWQILETRRSDSENDPPESENPEVQYVWSRRYIDAPVLRDRDVEAGGDLGKSGSGLDQRLYYTTDANMNVTALLDTAGDAVERYSCDPYGRVTIYDDDWSDTRSASSYDNAILYCGYFFDNETGLYHVRHRSYHPALGRWMQRDPIGYVDGMGLYEYVMSAPLVHEDPQGTQSTDSSDNGEAEGECCDPKTGASVPECPPPEGFAVSGWTVRPFGSKHESTGQKIGRFIISMAGAHHHNVYYRGRAIWLGFYGIPYYGAEGLKENPDHRWPLSRTEEGTLSWGDNAGLPCRCATAKMIKDCIQSAPTDDIGWRNITKAKIGVHDCHTDCERVTKGCCLTGYTAPSRAARKKVDNTMTGAAVGGGFGGVLGAVAGGVIGYLW